MWTGNNIAGQLKELSPMIPTFKGRGKTVKRRARVITMAYGSLSLTLTMITSDHSQKRSIRSVLFVALACAFACKTMYGQGGCLDSPEAPTDVLMGVGVAGMFYGSSIAMKALRRIRGR
jgi:XrtJ-associated TM-motif-TM protein